MVHDFVVQIDLRIGQVDERVANGSPTPQWWQQFPLFADPVESRMTQWGCLDGLQCGCLANVPVITFDPLGGEQSIFTISRIWKRPRGADIGPELFASRNFLSFFSSLGSLRSSHSQTVRLRKPSAFSALLTFASRVLFAAILVAQK